MDYPGKTPRQLRPLLVGFRKASGLTQAQMASHLGITQQTYAQLEAKPESASMERLFHVLSVLEVDIVLARALDPADLETLPPKRGRIAQSPVTAKQKVATKRTTTATTKTAPTLKAAAAPKRASGQASPKPAACKRVAPTAAPPRKREDW